MKRFRIFILFFSLLIGSDSRPFTIPTIELNKRTDLQTIVDQEDGIYLGHPSTVLLEDGNTILIVYPKGHGKGEIIYKRSEDGGKTWSDRLMVPHNWSSSKEVPTIHRVIDEKGLKRIILWSGLYPARLAVSENDGATCLDCLNFSTYTDEILLFSDGVNTVGKDEILRLRNVVSHYDDPKNFEFMNEQEIRQFEPKLRSGLVVRLLD